MIKIRHSESFQTSLVGKGTEQPKFGMLNDFIPLWWEKIGKSVK